MMRCIIGIVAALLAAAPALAQQQDAGFYLGGTIGQSEARDGCGGVLAGLSCDDKDTAWRILGGYQFNRNIGIEAGYHDLGEVSVSGPGGSASAESNAIELVGVGTLPLSNAFSLYGKAGIYRGETEGRLGIGGASAKDTSNDLTFGAGVKFDVTRNTALRVEWQRYNDMGGSSTFESDVDVLSLGAQLRF